VIDREDYDNKISSFIDKDEIVVLKGIRRCGLIKKCHFKFRTSCICISIYKV
jgi:hypothetical protein